MISTAVVGSSLQRVFKTNPSICFPLWNNLRKVWSDKKAESFPHAVGLLIRKLLVISILRAACIVNLMYHFPIGLALEFSLSQKHNNLFSSILFSIPLKSNGFDKIVEHHDVGANK